MPAPQSQSQPWKESGLCHYLQMKRCWFQATENKLRQGPARQHAGTTHTALTKQRDCVRHCLQSCQPKRQKFQPWHCLQKPLNPGYASGLWETGRGHQSLGMYRFLPVTEEMEDWPTLAHKCPQTPSLKRCQHQISTHGSPTPSKGQGHASGIAMLLL